MQRVVQSPIVDFVQKENNEEHGMQETPLRGVS